MTPTARSLKKLRNESWHAYVVERYISFAKTRIDVAGFGDILAWKNNGEVMLVQATTGGNVSHRLDKIVHGGLSEEDARAYLAWKHGGHAVQIHGWAKQGARGKRKLWTCRVVEM